MSADEIIAELPRLTEKERRTISREILALAAEQEEYAIADSLLIAACQELDRREASDAKAQPDPR
ncbi:MAG: hypothetical protein L0Z50_27920 [Verrucomicrobiales bacterium]|nr:hypothetical protein [Verrucomicrobiales bacterium]